MITIYELEFSKSWPKADKFFEKLEKETGFKGISIIEGQKSAYSLSYPGFPELSICFPHDSSEETIHIFSTSIKIHYLLEATVITLIKLGIKKHLFWDY